jgi:hypothetical protein
MVMTMTGETQLAAPREMALQFRGRSLRQRQQGAVDHRAGIATLIGVPPRNVNLFAPHVIIDAGDASIRVFGN